MEKNFEFDDVADEELDFVQSREKIPVKLHIVAIESKHKESDDCDCYTCTYGTWKRKGWDITMADDACGGCCSWNNKYEPLPKQNLSNDDTITTEEGSDKE